MAVSLFPNAGKVVPASAARGSVVRLINELDWSKTEIGPIVSWPDAVKVAVRILVTSAVPMCLMVGERGIMIYNEAYSAIAGKRHPSSLGTSVLDSWPEVVAFNRHVLATVLGGECLAYEDQEFTLMRNGEAERVWLDLDFSPLLGDDAKPIAVLAIVYETTKRVLSEQALARSEERLSFALSAAGAVGAWDWDVKQNRVTADARFAEMYGVDIVEAANGTRIERFIDGVHPDDRETVRQGISAALSGDPSFRMEYRLRRKDGEVRWVLALGQVIHDLFGKPFRLPGVVVDITERKKAEAALAESETRFRTLADAMPQMVWSTLPDGFHDYYNKRWYEFTGVPEGTTDGEGWNGMFHPVDQKRSLKVWQHSLQTGDPYEIEYRLRHHSGVYRWTLGRALPIRDESGAITRWIGTCTDIHEAKLAAEEREVIAQELSHRIKNIFSVLTGIVGLSARSHPEIKPLADQLRRRIAALGQAHDFVRPHSAHSQPTPVPASFKGLVGRLLAPYDDGTPERIRFVGPDETIDDAAATPLALMFHELGTNAAKYGSLSQASGSVTITTRHQDGYYRVAWKERGGPAIPSLPAGSGFGTRLIALSAEGQLGAKVRRLWDPEGLRIIVKIPVRSLTRVRAKAVETVDAEPVS